MSPAAEREADRLRGTGLLVIAERIGKRGHVEVQIEYLGIRAWHVVAA